VALALLVAAGVPAVVAQPRAGADVVATGVTRPLQILAHDRRLLVLSPGRGDVAGEILRVDLDAERPVDLARVPRVRIPFLDARLATLGSLARHGATGDLFLGEENGTRVYRLGPDERLTLYATGLRRLLGGSTVLIDGAGRLVIVDHVDPVLSPDDHAPPPGLEQFREEDYRGPLVFRLRLDADVPLPRRLAQQVPFFPRGWSSRSGGGLLPRFVSAVVDGDDLVLLASSGDLYRLAADGTLRHFVRLPRGQYQRTNMARGPDGSLYVSAGFWLASVFRVSPDGAVRTIASRVADPQGIAVDSRGDVYLAESSLHRIVRLSVD
jgi:hypothetical protein